MLFNLILTIISIFMLFTFPAVSTAVPAAPAIYTLSQPDGKNFKAKQWGDENSHGWETEDGYTILFDETLFKWTYAVQGEDGRLKSSFKIVGTDFPWLIQRGIRPSAPPLLIKKLSRESKKADMQSAAVSGITERQEVVQPAGTANVPVILINYSDRAYSYTTSQFHNLLFGSGNYSMRDYYNEVSYGAFNVSAGPAGVTGWYTAANTHAYYGQNDLYGNDKRPGTLVREAVQAADATINFAEYDMDGDCYVDVVMIVHQGGGEEASGTGNDIWSHRWNLNSAFFYGYSNGGEYVTNDACPSGGFIKINDYTIQPETLYGQIQTVGVFAHEYGHALGLPDLYDTDGSSNSIGDWCLMASGAWNSSSRPGDRPAHISAWAKYRLGWAIPTEVSGILSNELIIQAATAPDVYKLRNGSSLSGEYFLVENRQKTLFDAGLPASGLLIWHIDGNKISSKISSNTVNNAECYPGGASCSVDHYGVRLVQADNLWELEKRLDRGDTGDPYPGSTNKTSFTSASTPNSNLYNGQVSGVSITNISLSGHTMTATLSTLTCTYLLSPSSESFQSSGGTGSVNVTAQSGCNWTAVSNAAWIIITSGGSGSGNGTVNYSVSANTGAGRTGAIAIGGQNFNVTQSGTGGLTLGEAVDNTALTWTTGGNANWYGQASVSYNGGDAAQSGAITHSQTSWIQTTVTGPGSLTFNWRVSSEANYDFLRFTINGIEQARISGSVNWQHKTYSIPAGSYTLRWTYTKNRSNSSGSDAGWLDNVVFTGGGNECNYSLSPASQSFSLSGGTGSVSVTAQSACDWTAVSNSAWLVITSGDSGSGNGTVNYSVSANTGAGRTAAITIGGQNFTVTQSGTGGLTLGEAVDNTALTWTTGGNANWYGQTSVSYNGGDAAQSGAITHSQTSWIQTTVTGPGSLTFNWRVSSEANHDALIFSVNGIEQTRISGNVNWQQRTYSIPAGSYTLRWTYTKNRSNSSGSDAGWLDNVVFTGQ